MLNIPRDQVGKVFARAELARMAKIAEQHNLILMSDERVRLPLPFSETSVSLTWFQDESLMCFNHSHSNRRRLITLPSHFQSCSPRQAGAWAGSLDPSLIGPMTAATTRIVFCLNTPMQEAAAAGLEQAQARVPQAAVRKARA